MSTTETQPDLHQLQADFHRAVDAWRNPDFGDWQELWLGPECALLKYARAIDCDFVDAEDREKLSTLGQSDHRKASEYFNPDNATQEQTVRLMEGLVHGALAAEHGEWTVGKEQSDEFVEHAGRCIAAYQLAWPLSDEGDVVESTKDLDVFKSGSAPSDPVANVLDQLIGDQRFTQYGNYLTKSTWLTVRRLWTYLLEEKLTQKQSATNRKSDGAEVFKTETSILLVDENKGVVGPLAIRRAAEGQFACYLDPVALGQTLINNSMITSLQLAWRLCLPGLQQYVTDTKRAASALRLSPDLPGVVQISGGSAGGLFACGMYAAAHGISLNTDASASFVLNPPVDSSVDVKPAQITIGPVAEQTLQAKIDAAGSHGLRHVILEKEQAEALSTNDDGVVVHGVDNLADALRLLTGNAHIERVLEEYCRRKAHQWEQACADPNDRDHLQYYVPPHYALLKEGETPEDSSQHVATGEENDAPQSRTVRVTGDDEDAVLNSLLGAGRRLCITEDAGAGKSVFTRRAEAFMSSAIGQQTFYDGKPCLAVRWEQRVQNWPESFEREDLIGALAKAVWTDCEAVPSQDADLNFDEWCNQVAAWALDQSRVVLILDAMDQVTGNEATDSLQQFLHHQNENCPEEKRCRVILTSRAYRVADKQQLFLQSGGWQFGIIEGFDEEQQEGYLQRRCGMWLDHLFPTADCQKSMGELLKIPIVLDMVGQLAESGQLRPFDSRGSLYLQATDYFIDRAARRIGLEPNARLRVRWKSILAATAFEMMSRELYNYAVEGDEQVYDVQEGASLRLSSAVTEDEWEQIIEFSDLTDRCILEGADREMLGWKHRGMMEFYAGMHLARNSQPNWVDSSTPIRCGDPAVRKFAADADWYWAFRFAIELDPNVRQSKTLCASLAELFKPPLRGWRPSELMYRAWHLFEEDEFTSDELRGQVLPDAKGVVQAFRQQFRDLVDQRHSVALQLMSDDNSERSTLLGRRFVRCPPREANIDDQSFLMGSADDVGSIAERPRHSVVVAPFIMQSTTVTRGQYSLYDPKHACRSPKVMNKYSPTDDCPVIFVSWYDAVMFARFICGRLPTEAEWEYACRAGGEGLYCFGDDTSQLEDYAWFSKTSDNRTHPVGQLKPNAWGLYDMHGNVWEWCHDWHDSEFYELLLTDIPETNPTGPAVGSSRILRGGGALHGADGCRSAYRSGDEPDFRLNYLGFRVVRSCR